jgi:prevent-host-death family protein
LRTTVTKLNLAEIKQQLSELVDLVAEGETILILQQGKPVAKLVPAGAQDEPGRLANVEGWLEDDDPFFAAIEEIVEARSRRRPRVIQEAGAGSEADRR